MNFDLEPKFFHQNIPQGSRRHTYGNRSRLRDIGKDIKGVKMTPLGVYVDQKSLVFPGLIWKLDVCVDEKTSVFRELMHLLFTDISEQYY